MPPQAPAGELCSELLLAIFSLNANMHDVSEKYTPAVDTLRRISQVCSQWRAFMLDSPQLWRRVINLSRLANSPEWLKEVIRRTNGFSLFVKVHHLQHGSSTRGDRFARSQLERYWSKVEYLDLNTNSTRLERTDDAASWCHLLTRPSNLRQLRFNSPVNAQDLFPAMLPDLFPNLETIDLSESPKSFIGNVGRNSEWNLPSVDFPSLKRIKVQMYWPMSIPTVLEILQNVTPKRGCVLHFLVSLSHDFQVDVDPQLLMNVLPKYLQCASPTICLPSYNKAVVTLTQRVIDLQIQASDQGSSRDDDFRFNIDCEMFNLDHIIPTVVSCFRSFQFDRVEKLSLVVHILQLESAIGALQDIDRVFPSITHLKVDGSTLDNIRVFQDSVDYVVFPMLRTIAALRCTAQSIKMFLESRTAKGASVDSLAFSIRPDQMADIAVLHGFSGLTLNLLTAEDQVGLVVKVAWCVSMSNVDPSFIPIPPRYGDKYHSYISVSNYGFDIF